MGKASINVRIIKTRLYKYM